MTVKQLKAFLADQPDSAVVIVVTRDEDHNYEYADWGARKVRDAGDGWYDRDENGEVAIVVY